MIITNPDIDFFGGFCIPDSFKLSYLIISILYHKMFIYTKAFLQVTNICTYICNNIWKAEISSTKYVNN
jgi:hypothetical protein